MITPPLDLNHHDSKKSKNSKFDNFFDLSDDFLFLLDMKYNILKVNPMVCTHLGYDEKELANQNIVIVHPLDRHDEVISNIQNMIKNENKFGHVPLITKKGELIPVQTRIKISKGNKGDLLFVFSRNISHLIWIEDSLKLQRDLAINLSHATTIEEILEISLDSILLINGIDGGGAYTVDQYTGSVDLSYVRNIPDSFVKITSHYEPDAPQAQLIQKGEIIYNKFEKLPSYIKEKMENTKIKNIAILPIISNGIALACFNLTSEMYEQFPIRLTNSLEAIVAQIGDALARITTQNGLKEQKEVLENIFEAANTISFIFTDISRKEAKIMDFSPGAEMIFGYKKEEVIGKLANILYTKKDIKKYPDILSLQEKKKQGFRREITLVRKNGEHFPGLISTYPIFSRTGKIIKILSVSIDISEQKEKEFKSFHDQKIESIALLAGGIAHDFNNILVGILGNTQIIQLSDNLLEEDRELLHDLEMAAYRAKDLTNQLLTFSKGGKPIKKIISLENIIKNSVKIVSHGQKSIVELDIENQIPPIKADIGQLNQVFNNILINAQQSMPLGGKIKIKIKTIRSINNFKELSLKKGDYFEISIQDEGKGISPKNQKHIFEPYFSTKVKGHGLGLATCYSIIKQHSGIITFTSKEGVGTIFFIYLPIYEENIYFSQKIEKIHKKIEFHGKILIIDDDPITYRTLSNILQKLGFSVEIITDGRDLKEKIEETQQNIEEKFDLVIMDLTIPGGLGGKDAMKILNQVDPSIIAIVSSGYSNDPILANFSDYGFSGYLKKPFSIEQLIQQLQNIF